MFTVYQTDACLSPRRFGTGAVRDPSLLASPPANATDDASTPAAQSPKAEHAQQHDDGHSHDDSTPAAPVAKATARVACTELRIASNPRALVATRSARLSDRHARNLKRQGKHI
eukprot:1365066-Pleurochrysis_carterae.AAC.1